MGVSPSPHHIFLMEWESRQLDSTVSRFLFRALKKLNLTGQNGGRFFPSNSIWHFMAIDFWMGLCAKKEADIWNWNGLSNEGNSQPKGRRTFFWVAHRYLLRDYVHCSIQGGFLAHQRTQVRQEVRSSVLTNKTKPSFSAKGQNLSNLLAKYFLFPLPTFLEVLAAEMSRSLLTAKRAANAVQPASPASQSEKIFLALAGEEAPVQKDFEGRLPS